MSCDSYEIEDLYQYVPFRDPMKKNYCERNIRRPIIDQTGKNEFNGEKLPKDITYPNIEDISKNQDCVKTEMKGIAGYYTAKYPSLGGVSNQTKTNFDIYLPRRFREDEAGHNKYLLNQKVVLNNIDEDLGLSCASPQDVDFPNDPSSYCTEDYKQIFPYSYLIDEVFDPKTYNYVPRTVKSVWKTAVKYLNRQYFLNEIHSNKHNPYSIIDIYIEELIFYKNTRLTIINELLPIIKKLSTREDIAPEIIKSLLASYKKMINRLENRISRLERSQKIMPNLNYTDILEKNEMGGLLRDERSNYVTSPEPVVKDELLLERFKEEKKEPPMDNKEMMTVLVVFLIAFYYYYCKYISKN